MLGREGIEVSVICPGYVKSRMTERNDFPMPLLMEAGRAAAIICSGPAANKARIVFPRRLYAPVSLLASLPPPWTDPLDSKRVLYGEGVAVLVYLRGRRIIRQNNY